MASQTDRLLKVLLALAALTAVVFAQNPEHEARCAQASYSFFEDRTDCGQFVFCQDGTPEEFECMTDEIWSQTEASCVLGNRTTCELWDPKDSCVDLPDGPLIYPRNCRQFINCTAQQAEVIACLPGFIYVENATDCEVGDTVLCQSLVSRCAESGTRELFSHPNLCNAFIWCNETEANLDFCPVNHIFEVNIQFCVPGDAEKCVITPVDEICDELPTGVFPYPDDCTKFVQCKDGETVVVDCQPAEVFNPRISECAPGDAETCVLFDEVCANQRDGTLVGHPNHCAAYITCINETAEVHFCPINKIFRADMQFCVPGNNETCVFTPLEQMCVDIPFGTIYPHPDDCTQYVRCENNAANNVSCPANHIIEPRTIQCVPGDTETCLFLDALCEGINDGKLAIPNECGMYISCQQEVATILECPLGEMFDASQLRCVPGDEEECIPIICVAGENNMLVHPNHCNMFSLCDNGHLSLHLCPVYHIFHSALKVCSPGDLISCTLSPLDQMCVGRFDDSRFPYPAEGNCLQYVVCKSGQSNVESCPAETVLRPSLLDCFPGHTDTCELLDITCDPNNEQILPHPTRCDLKILCVAGFPTVQACPEGQIVDPITMNCVPGEVIDCFCRGKENGLYEHPMDCDRYVRCVDSTVEQNSCPPGEIFRADMLLCVPGDSLSCERTQLTDMCQGRPNDQRYPHPEECDKYVICTDNLPTVNECVRGNVIQPGTGACAAGNAETCGLYDDLCEERNIQHPGFCDVYIDCQSETTVAIPCSRGAIWDQDNTRCSPGTVDPCELLTVCSEEDKEEGAARPHPICDIFVRCGTEGDTIVECPSGEIFDETAAGCAPGDSETCELHPEVNICAEVPDDTLLPNPDVCDSYYRCEAGDPLPVLCPPGNIFVENGCAPGDRVGCENYIGRCSEEADGILAFPIETECQLFLACSNGVTSVGYCPDEEIMIAEEQLCAPGDVESCEIDEERAGFCSGLGDGRHAHPQLCYLYVQCTDGSSQVQACAANEIFSSDASDCIEGDRAGC
ncbi:uncharacterized protein LOC128735329 [Sabethes cyaneus]|uniref:uncharacterized protein LOC128735329 n=1 Tax=Sabethes cyaneus TaxID=53552 RepID=UPI00237E9B76|nr:uncharacterized protein LOC128735329 [Sabethes cyaneus]